MKGESDEASLRVHVKLIDEVEPLDALARANWCLSLFSSGWGLLVCQNRLLRTLSCSSLLSVLLLLFLFILTVLIQAEAHSSSIFVKAWLLVLDLVDLLASKRPQFAASLQVFEHVQTALCKDHETVPAITDS